MKISTQLDYPGGYQAAAQEAIEHEEAGLDLIWVAEAYGLDAVSLIGDLAGKTDAPKYEV